MMISFVRNRSAFRLVLTLLTALLAVGGAGPVRLEARQSAGCEWDAPSGRWVEARCVQSEVGVERLRVFSPKGNWPAGSIPDPESGETYWLFMLAGRRLPVLVMHFFRDDSGVAFVELYDDADGDGGVNFREENGRFFVTEGSGRWTVRVRAPDGWWRRGEVLNFNLDIEVAGPIIGMIDAPSLYLNRLQRDGKIVLTASVRDYNHNGKPEVEWRQAFPPLHDSDGFYHTSVMVNTHDDEPDRIGGFPYWPHLGGVTYEFVKPYFESPAPIMIDWETGRLRYLGEFVASRGRAGNYFIYSITRLKPERLTAVDFESPFAFYRFGDETPEYPDIALRVARANKGAPWYFVGGPGLSTTIEQVDYSWFHHLVVRGEGYLAAPIWDFKVSVAGRHPINTVVEFPEFALGLIPYAELPEWVTRNRWDFATFVAREGAGYPSTEGLYEWYPLEGAFPDAAEYLIGRGARRPERKLDRLPVEFRGEYTYQLGDQPWLYLHAIDCKLHLKGATGGYWNTDGERYVRYEDLDADGLIDHWRYEQGEQVQTSLTLGAGVAILGEGGTLRLIDTGPLPLEVFTALPPDSEATWHDLRNRLDAVSCGADPLQFRRSPLIPSDAATTEIEGATASAYRSRGGALSFVLTLEPGFAARGPNGSVPAWLQGARPGTYVVVKAPGADYQLQELTPATLELASTVLPGQGQDGPWRPAANEKVDIVTTVTNSGEAETGELAIALLANPEGGEPRRIETRSLRLAGGETERIVTIWAPPSEGRWTIEAVVDGGSAGPPVTIDATRAAGFSLNALLRAQAFHSLESVVLVVLFLSVLFIIGASWLVADSERRRGQPAAESAPGAAD